MTNLEGVQVALCQMPVIPGRPDLNTQCIIREIRAAAQRGVQVIVFPEMAVPGYFIGDLPEDDYFVRDVMRCNQQIVIATQVGIAAIWGTIFAVSEHGGEDGRLMKWNAGMVAQDGKLVQNQALPVAVKSLHPNYRIFQDDRHFHSLRKLAEMNDAPISDLLHPFPVHKPKTNGEKAQIQIGVILCEDMWHEDYAHNPTLALVENGAELIVNLSCSPWTWQKNRKRHQVVRDLLQEAAVPFVYVNNAGIQNTGKNLIVFDGSSTVYDETGAPVFSVDPYAKGTFDFGFAEVSDPIAAREASDTAELFLAIREATEGAFATLPPPLRKVVVGLSGGIDSATTCALFAHVLGPENVIAVNMPSQYNSQQTQDIAQQISAELGIEYLVRPIGGIVEAIATQTETDPDSLSYENIQARVRMEIIAAVAQDRGAVFSANGNKVELAFGYGTLYGDIAGFIAPLADLVKREVYQVADYLNQHIFKKEVIPQACFDMAPTAELKNNQSDPFDYGNVHRRGYHDEMVRAFTEFRRNPEWFLEGYLRGTLEKELGLESGVLNRLFASPREFVKDLERWWGELHKNYFKRVQAPPIPVVSKRAFGTDLREAVLPAHLTQRYHDLKSRLLARGDRVKRVAIFGGSFNPPARHHRQIAERLSQQFDLVVVVPCGTRPDKASVESVNSHHRAEMVKKAFAGIPKVQVDCFDLDGGTYTPAYLLQARYEKKFPDHQIWHVVGGDIIAGGHLQQSEIHRVWKKGLEIWQAFNFAIVVRPGYGMVDADLPPSYQVVEMKNLVGSSTVIRERISQGKPIDQWVDSGVGEYIRLHGLYLSN